jgi:transaldolase
LFVSRWDVASAVSLPPALHNKLGIAVAQKVFTAAQELGNSARWVRLRNLGARFQRVLWASTGSKDRALPAHYYVSALAAKDTVDTMPESTLLAFSRDGEFGALMSAGDAEADAIIAKVREAGLDLDALARKLQIDGRDAFTDSFDKLLLSIDSKVSSLTGADDPGKDAAE